MGTRWWRERGIRRSMAVAVGVATVAGFSGVALGSSSPQPPPLGTACPTPQLALGNPSNSAQEIGPCVLVPPAYPNYSDAGAINNQAKALSDRLLAYIQAWMAGTASPLVPPDVLPPNLPPGTRNYTLEWPDQVNPDDQWIQRPSTPVNWQAEPGLFPDPHTSYLFMPAMVAPFGTDVVVSGQFPHARFFDLQVSPPFDPAAYYDASSFIGVGEVPIVDADINPDPGSVNPFRVGADRSATDRNYTVDFRMAMGNATALNPSFRLPGFRGAGNLRVGGGIEYTGPWGCDAAGAARAPGVGCSPMDQGQARPTSHSFGSM